MGNRPIKDFESRIFKERDELCEKIVKLSAFVEGNMFDEVDEQGQYYLRVQLNLMCSYRDVLNQRLRHLGFMIE